MGSLVKFNKQENTPHLVINCSDMVYVIASEDIKQIVNGSQPLDTLPACVLRRIIEEWSENLPNLD